MCGMKPASREVGGEREGEECLGLFLLCTQGSHLFI